MDNVHGAGYIQLFRESEVASIEGGVGIVAGGDAVNVSGSPGFTNGPTIPLSKMS